MKENTFIFLKNEYEEIFKECNEMEDLIINGKYETAIRNSRHILELIVNKILNIEAIHYISTNLNTKINILIRRHILNNNIANDFHSIIKMGNLANYDDIESPQATAFIVHELIYNITKYFYENYNESTNPIIISKYQGLNLQKNDYNLEEMNSKIEYLYRNINQMNNNETNVSNKIDANSYHTKSQTMYGSYLYRELYRLNSSSPESVENPDTFSDFKKYLHIKRDIETELTTKLKNSLEPDKNNLILLCGNVGDGKSHLLSYLKENDPLLMKNFEIINDATESSDPKKDSIDRLNHILHDFNDKNINKNNKKMILSINLGVLNNFIDSKYAKNNYSILTSILNDLNIFDVNDFKDNFEKDPITIVNFSDNNLFEFNENHEYNVSSKYILELFSKITTKSEKNPFYNAYLKDKNNNLNNPIIFNYELFCIKKIQDRIVDMLIKIIIKYKIILSTRDLLNFIFEILVPTSKQTYSALDSKLDYIDSLLPNLLFDSNNRCEILQYIHKEDPLLKRNNLIDQLLMDINSTEDIYQILKQYIDNDFYYLIENLFNRKIEKNDFSLVTKTIIRIINLIGKEEIINLFTKKSYIKYIYYLINFNKGKKIELLDLIDEIEAAIFNWKGQYENNYLCVKTLKNFKIYQEFKLLYTGDIISLNNSNINRFKNNIHLEFFNNKYLDLDYSLYEAITRINRGYKPNKKEQEYLLIFDNFINELIHFQKTNKYIIYETDTEKVFKLEENESFGIFNFKVL